MAAGNGLVVAKEIYRNRSKRARELKGEGKKVLGYFCCYTPIELITAAGLVPYRIMGDTKEPTTEADIYLDPVFCPYVRTCFDIAMKGRYDFLDGSLWPTSCDNLINVYGIWQYNLKPAYTYQLSIPKVADSLALKFFKEDIGYLRQSLEELIGGEISDAAISQAVERHNENRALLRELYQLRQQDPPLLSGAEVTQILVAVMSLPVAEANQLLRGVIDEVKQRGDGPQSKSARLLISGNELDDSTFIELIEDCGANVVADDMCIGTRFFWHDVEKTADPLDGLANRYLGDIRCPRIYRGNPEMTRREEMEERFKHIRDLAKEYNVNGAIIYILKYCDSEEWEAPDLREYIQEELGLPVLHIEHDYSTVALAPWRTRVQAFVEMVG
jgi:benzoyl-CoA reductase subunit C